MTKHKPIPSCRDDGAYPAASYECAAYYKALRNDMRAWCLEVTVDIKIAEDIKLGQIRDFGNLLDTPICRTFPI